jgi:hypothetical protein
LLSRVFEYVSHRHWDLVDLFKVDDRTMVCCGWLMTTHILKCICCMEPLERAGYKTNKALDNVIHVIYGNASGHASFECTAVSSVRLDVTLKTFEVTVRSHVALITTNFLGLEDATQAKPTLGHSWPAL